MLFCTVMRAVGRPVESLNSLTSQIVRRRRRTAQNQQVSDVLRMGYARYDGKLRGDRASDKCDSHVFTAFTTRHRIRHMWQSLRRTFAMHAIRDTVQPSAAYSSTLISEDAPSESLETTRHVSFRRDACSGATTNQIRSPAFLRSEQRGVHHERPTTNDAQCVPSP